MSKTIFKSIAPKVVALEFEKFTMSLIGNESLIAIANQPENHADHIALACYGRIYCNSNGLISEFEDPEYFEFLNNYEKESRRICMHAAEWLAKQLNPSIE